MWVSDWSAMNQNHIKLTYTSTDSIILVKNGKIRGIAGDTADVVESTWPRFLPFLHLKSDIRKPQREFSLLIKSSKHQTQGKELPLTSSTSTQSTLYMIGYKINQILATHILMQIAPPLLTPPPTTTTTGMWDKNLPTQPLVLSTSPRLSGQWSLWHFRNEQNVWSDLTLCNTRIKDHLAILHDCSKFWAWRLNLGDKWDFHKALSSWSNNSILFFFWTFVWQLLQEPKLYRSSDAMVLVVIW